MPWTVAWMSWYARKLSRQGIEIPLVACVASSTQPTTNIRAHDSLWKSPSIEASLSGCSLVTSIAWFAPKTTTLSDAITKNHGSATFMLALARSTKRSLRRYHALTLHISAAPTVHDAAQTWRIRGRNDGVNTTSAKLVMTARPSSMV